MHLMDIQYVYTVHYINTYIPTCTYIIHVIPNTIYILKNSFLFSFHLSSPHSFFPFWFFFFPIFLIKGLLSTNIWVNVHSFLFDARLVSTEQPSSLGMDSSVTVPERESKSLESIKMKKKKGISSSSLSWRIAHIFIHWRLHSCIFSWNSFSGKVRKNERGRKVVIFPFALLKRCTKYFRTLYLFITFYASFNCLLIQVCVCTYTVCVNSLYSWAKLKWVWIEKMESGTERPKNGERNVFGPKKESLWM